VPGPLLRTIRGYEAATREVSARRILDLDARAEEPAPRSRETFGEQLSMGEVVRRILADVRRNGDGALRRWSKTFDAAEPKTLEVSREAIESARVEPALESALELAAQRIRDYHARTMPRSWANKREGLGLRVVPIERVGVYAPGGTAIYPSTVLMTAIPAKVAGAKEVFLTTPTRDGRTPHASLLVAARLAGVDRVFQVGGVQAIGALAYGTESVPAVDKVCGPGNLFVTLAKRMVFGQVELDGLYGPTETVLVADESANPRFCAADLLAQAEHDTLASPIFITTSEGLLRQVEAELERQLATFDRASIARASLERNGRAFLVASLDEALELANLYAPEHLCLLVSDPWAWLERVRNAGGVFVGETSPEVLGDYVAGPSHVMPTGGTARFASALGVAHFLKLVPVIGLDRARFARLAPVVSTIGRAEGLTGHAHAVEVRLESLRGGEA